MSCMYQCPLKLEVFQASLASIGSDPYLAPRVLIALIAQYSSLSANQPHTKQLSALIAYDLRTWNWICGIPEVSPEIPTAPTTYPSFSIRTPPGTRQLWVSLDYFGAREHSSACSMIIFSLSVGWFTEDTQLVAVRKSCHLAYKDTQAEVIGCGDCILLSIEKTLFDAQQLRNVSPGTHLPPDTSEREFMNVGRWCSLSLSILLLMPIDKEPQAFLLTHRVSTS